MNNTEKLVALKKYMEKKRLDAVDELLINGLDHSDSQHLRGIIECIDDIINQLGSK